ncbi:MAG: ABC transporter permease [Planctomycetes bacterium]|nr:ABC transporter permease [Planctomycetota bacterium]
MYRPFLSLRWLVTRPINLLGVGGVTLGVFAMIVVVSIFSGFLKTVSEHIRSASADIAVQALPSTAQFPALQRALAEDPNVAAAAPRLVHFGMLHEKDHRPPPPPLLGRGSLQGGDTPFLIVLGIDPAREFLATRLREWLEDVPPDLRVNNLDAPLEQKNGHDAILLGAERMRNEGLKPGDLVVLTSGKLQRSNDGLSNPDPIDHEFVISGAFHTRHIGYDGNNTLVDIAVLQQMLKLPITSVHEIIIKVRDPKTTEDTADRLTRAVRRTLQIEDLEERRGPVARSWRYRNRFFLQSIEWQRELMKIILIVIMVVAAVLMFATLSMMVTEKTSDIGILTAMGGTPRGVMSVFLGCGMAITSIGIALGTLAGCLGSIYLENFRQLVLLWTGLDLFPVKVYNLDRVPYDLDPIWIMQVACTATIVGIVVSALPAYRAARHDPLVSLRGT